MGLMHAGNQVSKAEARVDCAARVFVDVYAKAVAEAAVNADCTKFSDNSIYSNVITEVTTDVDWTEFCDYDDSVVGSANVELYGDTYADAVRSVCCACCVRFHPCHVPGAPVGQRAQVVPAAASQVPSVSGEALHVCLAGNVRDGGWRGGHVGVLDCLTCVSSGGIYEHAGPTGTLIKATRVRLAEPCVYRLTVSRSVCSTTSEWRGGRSRCSRAQRNEAGWLRPAVRDTDDAGSRRRPARVTAHWHRRAAGQDGRGDPGGGADQQQPAEHEALAAVMPVNAATAACKRTRDALQWG